MNRGNSRDAAIGFVRKRGKEVLITDVEHLREALGGGEGTVIAP